MTLFSFSKALTFSRACGLVFALLLAGGSAAQTGSALTGARGGAPGAVVQTGHVRAELMAWAPEGLVAQGPLWLGLQLQHQRGWHTYWKNPGDSGLPTQFKWQLPAGLSAGEIDWPMPHQQQVGPLVNHGYEGTVLLPVPVRILATPEAASLEIRLHASWLVCERECVPEEGDFALQLPARSALAGQAQAFQSSLAQRPRPWPQAQAQAQVKDGHVDIQVRGLPEDWKGRPLAFFPETAELLQAGSEGLRRPRQSWSGAIWQAHVPLSGMRSSSPSQLPMVLTQGQHAIQLNARISGTWPPLDNAGLGLAAPAAVATATPAPVDAAPARLAPTGLGAYGLALLGALLGGLILNFMPCVFPVLSIKLLSLVRHSQDIRAQRLGALAYSAGVLLSFLGLGVLMLGLRAAGEGLGWGFQLQSPLVVVGLAVLFAVMGLNLAGQFEFGAFLPGTLAGQQWRHPTLDAFLSGVLAVAVASPCTAPFMGASLGLALSLPAAQALVLFGALGLGMASPYLLVGWLPSLSRHLPKPGPWMEVLRRAMAFPMFATVVWLVWVLGQQTGVDAVAALLALLTLLAWLLWALGLAGRSRRFMASLALLGLLGWGQWLAPSLFTPPEAAQTAPSTATVSSSQAWQPWNANRVPELLAQGRPVFVDFTAAWCVTCQYNKKTVLSDPSVLGDFAAAGVQLLRADWTRRDPAITTALAQLGRNGVPVYVLYRPGHAPQVLSEILSVSALRQALADRS